MNGRYAAHCYMVARVFFVVSKEPFKVYSLAVGVQDVFGACALTSGL